MISIRKAHERGHSQLSWLDSRFTFSFDHYHDPEHMGFRSLRVINEDHIAPGGGFGTHPHRDMEIITYVISGTLEHKDSTGDRSVIHPGDLQRMSAGTGISHSEFNHSQTERVHLLQIWILPDRTGLHPEYEQRTFDRSAWRDRLTLLASPDDADGSLTIHQDVGLWVATLEPGVSISHELAQGRHAWIQVVRGGLTVDDLSLNAGDGAAISDENEIHISAVSQAEFLLFDLA